MLLSESLNNDFIHIPYTVIFVLPVYSCSNMYTVIHPFTGNGVGIGYGSTCLVLFHCILLYDFMMLLSYQGDYNYILSKLILSLYPNKFLPSLLFLKIS